MVTPLLLTGSHYPLQRRECQPEVSSVFTWWPLAGEHFENQIAMRLYEVLDPQNSPVRSGEESMGLASELLKTHPSGVQYPVMINVSHSAFRIVTVSVSSPGRGLRAVLALGWSVGIL